MLFMTVTCFVLFFLAIMPITASSQGSKGEGKLLWEYNTGG
jgi:hypothetical protein